MKPNRILVPAILFLGIAVMFLYRHGRLMEAERDRYQGNAHALLSDIRRMRIDSATAAVDVRELRMTLNEYELYRVADAKKMREMGVCLKDLRMAAKHELTVNAQVEAELKDSVIIRDTVLLAVKAIDVHTPFLQISGMIENNHLSGSIHLPVTLRQAVWIEPKRRFLWWRWGVKAVHQTIASDNPHVEIKYSEVIEILK